MKPIIGIVGRAETESDKMPVSCIYDDYRNCIIKSGAVPIGILPPQNLHYIHHNPLNIKKLTNKEKDILNSELELCDGIILQGGYTWFEYDSYVLEYALKNNMPTLGICLGMQLIANYMTNDDKVIDKTYEIKSNINHSNNTHLITINKDSLLYSILLKEEITVNSYHKTRIIDNKSIVKAYAQDNTPEVVEIHEKAFILGVQWHPEKNYKDDENSKKIFKSFIDAAKTYKLSKRN